MLIIKDGSDRPIGAKMKNNKNIYRALCEKDGKLCIIESKKKMTYEAFVKCLSDYESKMAPSYKYRTNWITFYNN